MQFTLPYQDILIIPSGAGPGDPRIVIDGINGRIDLFDATHRVATFNISQRGMAIEPDNTDGLDIVSIQSDAGDHGLFVLGEEGTAPIVVVGRIDLFQLGSYSTAVRIAAPLDDITGAQAQLFIVSEDVSAGLPPTFRFRDQSIPIDLVQIDGLPNADIKFNDGTNVTSMARGLHSRHGPFATNDVTRAPGTNTDFFITRDFNANNWYRVHVHSRVQVAAFPGILNLTEDGTIIGQLSAHTANPSFVSTPFLYQPSSTGSHTLRVFISAASAGNVQLLGAATNPRAFWVEHIGR